MYTDVSTEAIACAHSTDTIRYDFTALLLLFKRHEGYLTLNTSLQQIPKDYRKVFGDLA